MRVPVPVTISAAVEGDTDEAVVRILIRHVGAEPGTFYGKKGKPHLKNHISGYNNAAHRTPWFVLVDLDRDAECAPPLVEEWIPIPAPFLCFRVAVRTIEAWLLADAESVAAFFGIARRKVPIRPENVGDPKSTMVNLARISRSRDIRLDMVPREGSGRSIGPAYPSRLIEFTTSYWRPEQAAIASESLRRAIACLQRLAMPA